MVVWFLEFSNELVTNSQGNSLHSFPSNMEREQVSQLLLPKPGKTQFSIIVVLG